MTISAELQERYKTECDIDWRNAFVLTHKGVYTSTAYIIDHTEPFEGLVDGELRTFAPSPHSSSRHRWTTLGRKKLRSFGAA